MAIEAPAPQNNPFRIDLARDAHREHAGLSGLPRKEQEIFDPSLPSQPHEFRPSDEIPAFSVPTALAGSLDEKLSDIS